MAAEDEQRDLEHDQDGVDVDCFVEAILGNQAGMVGAAREVKVRRVRAFGRCLAVPAVPARPTHRAHHPPAQYLACG
jgi:hypothetical protein